MALIGTRSAVSAAIGDSDAGEKRHWTRADVVGLLEKTGEGCIVDGRRPGREEKDLLRVREMTVSACNHAINARDGASRKQENRQVLGSGDCGPGKAWGCGRDAAGDRCPERSPRDKEARHGLLRCAVVVLRTDRMVDIRQQVVPIGPVACTVRGEWSFVVSGNAGLRCLP